MRKPEETELEPMPKTVRKETRTISADGKTMTVESVRGADAPIVMVFEKK